MRWERLFDDLEAQVAAAEAEELTAEVAERVRIEHGRVPLVARWRAAAGLAVTVGCDGERFAGTVVRVAADAAVLAEATGGQTLLPLAAVDWVTGLSRAAVTGDPGPVAAGVGLRTLLRAAARDRLPVRARLRGGSVVTGTIDTVGADWIELAEHPIDEPRRPAAVRAVRVIPLLALVALRSD